ncbi:MAG TPA: glycosyltransferase family 2 protein [Vicinamibacterales bacterium]|nr:glycosyltransferase family 2 protein [Vicinamibacterales bacterium]
MVSILTPAFNETVNLENLHTRLTQTMAQLGDEWEWLIVDDHSRDDTFAVVQRLALMDSHVRGIRLARNRGSHVAITCGLHHVRGDAAVMMASDLQDPPETLGALLQKWRSGAQVVWATRREQPGEKTHAGFASVYYWIMRNIVGMKEIPVRGADFFLIDRVVIDAFRRCDEQHVSVFALITWLGFRQEYIEYDKQPRAAGRSGWTIARKIKLVVDSITAFSDAPIQACWLLGAALMVIGFLSIVVGLTGFESLQAALVVLLGAIAGGTGLVLCALAMLGEYVWRALDQSRRRPLYLIESTAGPTGAVDGRSSARL